LKHRENIPSWMSQKLEEIHLNKTSFSKYCHFMARSVHGIFY